jgi:glycosyltransferase involved in cell wall biosynthesis
MTKISVIVPTYNRPAFLERALSSIDAQTFQDFEVIVVNDGGDPVCGVVNKHPQVTLVDHCANKGLPAARNTGIRAAKGKYITFLDDDDIYYPDHLETLVGAMDSGAQIAYTDSHLWENEINKINWLSVDYDRRRLHQHNLFPAMCLMVRRELFDSCMFDESLKSHEDWDCWLRMSRIVKDFVHIKKATCAYSKRGGQDQISNRDYHIEAYREVKKRYER